jgi:hypothetical protein
MAPHPIRVTMKTLRKCFWKYRIAFGFLCLATGILLAVILLQNETSDRISADREATKALRAEVEKRAQERMEIDAEQAEQLAQLEKVNRTQNAIIRALLTLRKNDPDLFEGVNLPTPAEFEEQVGADRKEGGSGSTSRPKPTKPRPTKPKPNTPGPTPRDPSPTTPTPVAPTPVPPAPNPPVRPPVLPPPPAQPPNGPVVDPIIDEVTCPALGICLPNLGL